MRGYSERSRPLQRKPSGLGLTGIGFHSRNHQEAYDAEPFVILRDIRHLASRLCSGRNFTVLTDPQAAIVQIQTDAPRPGQDMATEIIGLVHTHYDEGNTLTAK